MTAGSSVGGGASARSRFQIVLARCVAVLRPVRLPRLEVAPVRDERPVERGLVALEGVGRPEEVAAGPDVGDRLEAEAGLVDRDRLEDLRHHLQDLGVDDQLLERRGQAALEPAGALVEQVDAAHDRAPHGHLRFVGRLGVDDVRRGRVRRAPGQAVAAGELAAGERALDRLRRPERRRAGPHVHVRGERAVDHRGAGPDDLRQCDEEERLGVLLGERARQRDRAHRAGQGERRRHHGLAVERHLHQAVAHRPVEPERRVRVDDRHQRRLAQEVVAGDAPDQARDLERVLRPAAPRSRGTARSCRARPRRSGTCRDGGSRPAGRSARAGRRPPGG